MSVLSVPQNSICPRSGNPGATSLNPPVLGLAHHFVDQFGRDDDHAIAIGQQVVAAGDGDLADGDGLAGRCGHRARRGPRGCGRCPARRGRSRGRPSAAGRQQKSQGQDEADTAKKHTIQISLLGHRVIAAGIERIAAQDSPGRHQTTSYGAMFADGFEAIMRTSRVEAARIGRQRSGESVLIEPNEPQQQGLQPVRRPPIRVPGRFRLRRGLQSFRHILLVYHVGAF